MRWDPQTYLQFADERGRPFDELLARVRPTEVRTVVDLGCGPGHLTETLLRRWPDASVEGVDSSEEMVRDAQARAVPDRLAFTVGDLRDWQPAEPVDVLVTNATLQWVPGRLSLLPRLLDGVRPGGWFAMQVPGNVASPTHTAIAAVCAQPRWRERLGAVAEQRPAASEPVDCLEVLAPLVSRVDVWETTYLQVLQGPDPIVRWVSGTALRPILSVLSAEEQAEFLAEYRPVVAEAYPERSWGTVLPFRRIFAVAKR